MKVKVTEKKVMITEITEINEGEYAINECEFKLPGSFDNLSVTAVFNGIPAPLVNSKCIIPPLKNGNCVLGVYAYKRENDETVAIYSPRSTMFFVGKGSFTDDFVEADVPQLADYDMYCEQLREYWFDLIKSNTIPEYTEEATDKQYYSAKVINKMYKSIKGDIDDICTLVDDSYVVVPGVPVYPPENNIPQTQEG